MLIKIRKYNGCMFIVYYFCFIDVVGGYGVECLYQLVGFGVERG